jgi:hypothetical protein
MDPDVVLARTPRGAEALEKHDHDLPRSLRHALILVDGRSTVARLEQRGAMIPDFPAALRDLVARGLVAPLGHAVPAAANGGRSLGASLVTLAETVLGDKSGKVARRLAESGQTREELTVAVDACYKLIRLTIDEARAEEFRTAAKDLLSRAG